MAVLPDVTREKIDALRLARSQNVGIKTFFDLIRIYGTPTRAIAKIPELAAKGGMKNIAIYSEQEALTELAECEKLGASIISYFDPEYPSLLKNIYSPPALITVFGKKEILNRKKIAIVGSRNSSLNGDRFAYKIANELAEQGFVIVSGLAKGIDTAAHKASTNSGTIAVIAGGIGNIYPKENEELYYKIAETGLVISELPLGAAPKAQNFPQRNRIISGLSYGTLVVEANLKSGSLITARFALEQMREVFAVPGFPLDPRAEGTNKLIKQGAVLTTSIEDILENISSFDENSNNFLKDSSDNDFLSDNKTGILEEDLQKARVLILKLLNSSAISIDMLIAKTNLRTDIVLSVILELELAGKIYRDVGNKISLIYI